MSNEKLLPQIQSLADKYYPKMVQFRRHLHMNPELSYMEKETSAFVSSVLKEAGIPHDINVGGYGIVAQLEGTGEGPAIMLRADMDALPIQEEGEKPYKSTVPGVMHACGHDAHTSCLLGALLILNECKKDWSGKVIGVFQPAEEQSPGGAKAMLEDGLMEKYKPSLAFGQHVHPPLPSGKVAFIPGDAMASADEIHLTVKGQGGHAAIVRDCIDPIPIAAQIIQALQTLVSRKADPFLPTVISIGKITTPGGASNVIPSTVQLTGTMRTFNEDWRGEIHDRLTKMCKLIAESNGGSCMVNIKKGYPSLYNHPELTMSARKKAEILLGKDQVVEMDPRMTAEDFSYFALAMPACFFRLGTAAPGQKKITPIHTPGFDIDENALRTGSMLMAWLAASK